MKNTRWLAAFVLVAVAAIGAGAQITYPNPINHIIVIDQENRSTDNLLGSNAPGNQYYLPDLDVSTTGQAYTLVKGQKSVFTVQAVAIPLASDFGSAGSVEADDYDPGHSHSQWITACDAPLKTDPGNMCAMDGFNHIIVTCDLEATDCPGPPYPTYAYVQYPDVAPYFQMASQYGYANYMFQTNQGPSFPSHQFIFGGTSQPGNGPQPSWFVSENASVLGTPQGCLATPSLTVQLVNPSTQDETTKMYPCFNHRTLADVFASATPKITWTYYATGPKSMLTAPNAIQNLCTVKGGICTGQYWTKGKSNGYVDGVNPADILTDISNCNLRQVNWVVPLGLQSDHAGATDGSGPSWVASIINAIGNQRKCRNGEIYWNNTVILVTWDDWGGWYEHVVPPAVPSKAPPNAASNVYGFRVPLFVVSAYTPAGTVSNVMGLDFGAMIKFIEEIFNLGTIPPGNYADAYAYDDLGEFFEFSAPPRSFQSISAPVGREVFLDPKRRITPADND
jgi:phospholipase C